MSLIRPSRFAAAIVMLVGMLMMQISIAACRCLEAPAAAERNAHRAHDDQAGASCDNCIEYLELAKKLSDNTDHPRVAPFTPSALHLVLDEASAITLASARPDAACDRLAGMPQLRIQHCSFQL